MKRYYGPYARMVDRVETWHRPILKDNGPTMNWIYKSGSRWIISWDPYSLSSRELAMEVLDRRITQEGGVLLTQEQWDKFSLLL